MSEELFIKDISKWEGLLNPSRPTLHELFLMNWHDTDELPPEQPTWVGDFNERSGRIADALDTLTELGYDTTGFYLPDLTDEQQTEYEAWQEEMESWRNRHPHCRLNTSHS
jgi:hypothetical protein